MPRKFVDIGDCSVDGLQSLQNVNAPLQCNVTNPVHLCDPHPTNNSGVLSVYPWWNDTCFTRKVCYKPHMLHAMRN